MAAALPLIVLLACAGDDAGGGASLPPFTADCARCHDLAAPAAAPGGPARDHLATAGEGLVREDPVFPTPDVHLRLVWPGRGTHDATARADCSPCHPVRAADGVGHGARTYPDPASAFRAGTDCAPACHAWIAADRRPGDLLAADASAHGAMWKSGARPADPTAFRFGGFNGGCGACHNAFAEDHGAVAGCLDCHAFGGPAGETHSSHVAAAGGCDACHAPEAGPTATSRAACYGCHPSAHSPRPLPIL